jgi:hypothetical protein
MQPAAGAAQTAPVFCWLPGSPMKFFCRSALLVFTTALAARAEAPPEIFFNGIFTLFGDHRVLFKTHSGDPEEKSFMLAEGEARDGIRLLAVDIHASIAQFDNHGVIQKISICPTPDLVTAASATITAGQKSFSGASSATAVAAGGPDSFSPATSAASSFSAANGIDAAAQTGADASAGQTDKPVSKKDATQNTWWYRGSQQMEAARVATAAVVGRGELPAYPLTPLTPPGTPAVLIGSDQLYFNHFVRQF